MNILKPSDFVGKYQLSTGMFDVDKLTDYITRYEKKYLIDLFGVTLYNEFISDLDGVNNYPQSPNFIYLYEDFAEDFERLGKYKIIRSEGLKEVLKGCIYFEYSKDLINQMTPYGNVTPEAENSKITSTLYTMIYNRYNEAVNSFSAIQHHIIYNYGEPTGELVTISVLNGGTGYVDGQYNLINGTGTGGEVDIMTDGAGVILEAVIILNGQDYINGDILTVDSGNLDGTITADYVGKGVYSTFNGVNKESVYWI